MTTPAEARFKRAVRFLALAYEYRRRNGAPINDPTYPSATNVYRMLGREAPKRRSMNGRECSWRESVLSKLGWAYVDRHMFTWEPAK